MKKTKRSLLLWAIVLAVVLAGGAVGAAPELTGISFESAVSFANAPDGPVAFDGQVMFSYTISAGMENIAAYEGGKMVFKGETPGVEFGFLGQVNDVALAKAPETNGFAFYFKNNGEQEAEIGIAARCYVNGDLQGYGLDSSAEALVLLSADGSHDYAEVAPNNNIGGQGTLLIPAEFEGYIFVPYTALYNQNDAGLRLYDPATDVFCAYGHVVLGGVVDVTYGDAWLYTGDLSGIDGALPTQTHTKTPAPTGTAPAASPSAAGTAQPTETPAEKEAFPVLGYVAIGVVALAAIGTVVFVLTKKKGGEN